MLKSIDELEDDDQLEEVSRMKKVDIKRGLVLFSCGVLIGLFLIYFATVCTQAWKNIDNYQHNSPKSR
jgi:hypothetical protein